MLRNNPRFVRVLGILVGNPYRLSMVVNVGGDCFVNIDTIDVIRTYYNLDIFPDLPPLPATLEFPIITIQIKSVIYFVYPTQEERDKVLNAKPDPITKLVHELQYHPSIGIKTKEAEERFYQK